MTWIGHATVLIETGGVRLLTDPVLGRRIGLLRRVTRVPSPDVLDRIDAVLVSHLHSDHVELRSLRRAGRNATVLASGRAVAWLRRHGVRHAHPLAPGATVRVGGIAIEATPARHDGRRWPVGAPVESVGFHIDGPARVYFAGDTDLFPEMAALRGRVDIALLPVWGWGPDIGPGHLDPERAARAAAIIEPELAIPIHWGTLTPIGTRPSRARLAEPARAFAAESANVAPAVDVRVLEPGERTTWCGNG